MRILIIEDEYELCEAMAEGLRVDGYEVDTCQNGEEGLDNLFSAEYDLIL